MMGYREREYLLTPPGSSTSRDASTTRSDEVPAPPPTAPHFADSVIKEALDRQRCVYVTVCLVVVVGAGVVVVIIYALVRPVTVGEIIKEAVIRDSEIRSSILLGSEHIRGSFLESALTDPTITGGEILDSRLHAPVVDDGTFLRPVLTEASLSRPSLTDASLTRSNLTEARLSRPVLTDASLSKPNLTEAVLTSPKVTNGVLATSALHGGTLHGTSSTTYNLQLAYWTSYTTETALIPSSSSRCALGTSSNKFRAAYSGIYYTSFLYSNDADFVAVQADLNPAPSGLAVLSKINLQQKTATGRPQLNVRQLQDVLPEAVHRDPTDAEDALYLNRAVITDLLVAAMKELAAENESLRNELKALKADVQRLL